MRVNDWLVAAEKCLKAAGIGTARLDALVLMEHVTGLGRAKLLAEPDHQISAPEKRKLQNLLNRRVKHVPLAYLRGMTEFYGHTFLITAAVLEPRPESETMIDLLKQIVHNQPGHPKNTKLKLADVGCGCGAIGITAKLEMPDLDVNLLDLDSKALKIAQRNVDKFTLSISCFKSDLLKDTHTAYDILACNLPYVPDNYKLNRAAMQEPSLAIFGGPDGLDVYRRLFDQLQILKAKPLYILCESLPPQHSQLAAVAKRANYILTQSEDFIQVYKNQA